MEQYDKDLAWAHCWHYFSADLMRQWSMKRGKRYEVNLMRKRIQSWSEIVRLARVHTDLNDCHPGKPLG
jgi:hypothetical protein